MKDQINQCLLESITLSDFIKKCEENKAPIVLYGAGGDGIARLKQLKQRGVCVDFFCDRSENKIGTYIEEIEVISPKMLKAKVMYTNILICISRVPIDAIVKYLRTFNLDANFYNCIGDGEYFLEGKLIVNEPFSWFKSIPWHFQYSFKNTNNFSKKYIEALLDNYPKSYFKDDKLVLANQKSEFVNVINNNRVTCYVPEEYDNTLYLFGDCRVVGLLSEDKNTIESVIQKNLNNELKKKYRVVNKGRTPCYMNHHLQLITKTRLLENDIVGLLLSPQLLVDRGFDLTTDIISNTLLFFSYINLMNEYCKSCGAKFYFFTLGTTNDIVDKSEVERFLSEKVIIDEIKNPFTSMPLDIKALSDLCLNEGIRIYDLTKDIQRPHNYGEIFVDAAHLSPNGYHLLGDRMTQIMFGVHNKKNVQPIKMLYESFADKFLEQNKNYEIDMFTFELQEIAKDKPDNCGAIVMNCNPFTKGHRYLIETALRQVDHLYIFVLEEDKSYFSFDTRFKLVKKGVADLENVTVLKSGKFIISSLTFPEYFNKDIDPNIVVDCSNDLQLFCEQVALALKINKRFVGTEPYCSITKQYNRQMSEMLPKYGIEYIEIERIKFDDTPISASRVRRLLNEKKYDELKDIVPPTTYDYLVKHLI